MQRFILVVIAALLPLAAAMAKDPVYSSWLGGAINGYDPVAYFTDAKPVKGSKQHQLKYQGADWYFASAAHRDLFEKNPEKYAPQYGGYCAWAVANGYTASTDPDAWTIHNGRLYLNYSTTVRDQWNQARDENISKADQNWPGVLE